MSRRRYQPPRAGGANGAFWGIVIVLAVVACSVIAAVGVILANLRTREPALVSWFEAEWRRSPVLVVMIALGLFIWADLVLTGAAEFFWRNRAEVLGYWQRRNDATPAATVPVPRGVTRGLVTGTIGFLIVGVTLALLVGAAAAAALGPVSASSSGLFTTTIPGSTLPATATPTRTPTPSPTPVPTATPIPPTPPPCTTLNCNPWGYTFAGGNHITNPPLEFCSYFPCIPNFWNGTGYVVECDDALYSKSGGNQGVCSQHGGVLRILYAP
jgi:hypothetical protein